LPAAKESFLDGQNMLDFKNQTLFLYTTASRDEEGRGEDLVIQAVVSRSGTSFPYFTGGQNEMEGVWEGGGGVMLAVRGCVRSACVSVHM
jgi:hypothetical protein